MSELNDTLIKIDSLDYDRFVKQQLKQFIRENWVTFFKEGIKFFGLGVINAFLHNNSWQQPLERTINSKERINMLRNIMKEAKAKQLTGEQLKSFIQTRLDRHPEYKARMSTRPVWPADNEGVQPGSRLLGISDTRGRIQDAAQATIRIENAKRRVYLPTLPPPRDQDLTA